MLSSPGFLLILSILSVIAITITVFFEYRARKADYFALMRNQSELFIKSLTTSTQNTLSAAETIERELNSRILSSMRMIELQDRRYPVTGTDLDEYLAVINVRALHIYDSAGNLQINAGSPAFEPLPPMLVRSGPAVKDTVITLIDYEDPEKDRLAALVPRTRGGVIAGFIDRSQIQMLKKSLGIGYLLKRFQAEKHIEYVVIQNSQTIVAGSFTGYTLSSFSNDRFLGEVQNNGRIESRVVTYASGLIFETISPFEIYGGSFGILRLGLSMAEYEGLQKDIQRRLFVVIGVLAIFGFIFMHFMINYRRRRYLHRDLDKLKRYTNSVLENLSTGVISVDDAGKLQTVNRVALEYLELDPAVPLTGELQVLPQVCRSLIRDSLQSPGQNRIKTGWITGSGGQRRLFSFTANCLHDEDGQKSCILLMNDITDQRLLDDQRKRNQRLTAMRNMALSVAHEIKNPLNAIKLLIDLIRKRTVLVSGKEKFLENIATVSSEIERISSIVDAYLKISKPPALKIAEVDIKALLNETKKLFAPALKQKGIQLRIKAQQHPPFFADGPLLKQVFINLVKNAMEAMETSGRIDVIGNCEESHYEIQISDTGRGIPDTDISSIFDWHFSTKEKGSGIGLNVVQQIIAAHRGYIDVTSEQGRGTTFIIQLPMAV